MAFEYYFRKIITIENKRWIQLALFCFCRQTTVWTLLDGDNWCYKGQVLISAIYHCYFRSLNETNPRNEKCNVCRNQHRRHFGVGFYFPCTIIFIYLILTLYISFNFSMLGGTMKYMYAIISLWLCNCVHQISYAHTCNLEIWIEER